MSVGALCNREVAVTGPETTVAEAARLMRNYHVGDLVILGEERKPEGLVTDRDIVVEVMAKGLDPESLTVTDIMTQALTTVSEETDFWDALAHMRLHGIRRLPIVSVEGTLTGILTLDDAVELVGEAVANLAGLVAREIDHERERRPADR